MADERDERWTYTAGTRPHTVTVYERGGPGGIIYARAWNAAKGSWTRKSLKHRDRNSAQDYATEQAAKLLKGDADIRRGRVTVAQVFALY